MFGLYLFLRIGKFDRVHSAEDGSLAAEDAFFVFGGVKNVQRAGDHCG